MVDSDGKVYINARNAQIKRQAPFKETSAWMLVSVLKGYVGEGGTGQKANFGNFTIAGKIGTNSDYRGVFFAGMSGYYSGCRLDRPRQLQAAGLQRPGRHPCRAALGRHHEDRA